MSLVLNADRNEVEEIVQDIRLGLTNTPGSKNVPRHPTESLP